MSKKECDRRYREKHGDRIRAGLKRWYENLTPEQREHHRKRSNDWRKRTKSHAKRSRTNRKNNLLKVNAWRAVWYAIKKGRLVRPSACSKCGVTCRPEGHHTDYSKVLDVIWLCKACHCAAEGKVKR